MWVVMRERSDDVVVFIADGGGDGCICRLMRW
jgi:hypothetical protein